MFWRQNLRWSRTANVVALMLAASTRYWEESGQSWQGWHLLVITKLYSTHSPRRAPETAVTGRVAVIRPNAQASLLT